MILSIIISYKRFILQSSCHYILSNIHAISYTQGSLSAKSVPRYPLSPWYNSCILHIPCQIIAYNEKLWNRLSNSISGYKGGMGLTSCCTRHLPTSAIKLFVFRYLPYNYRSSTNKYRIGIKDLGAFTILTVYYRS